MRPRPRQSRSHAFDDPAAIELCDGPEDGHLQLACRRGGVNPSPRKMKPDAERLQVLEERRVQFLAIQEDLPRASFA